MDAKFLRNELLNVLENSGIPESKALIKFPKKSKNNWLGWYRNFSQFKSQPIIYIDVNQHEIALREMGEFSEQNLKKHIMDTMLHEYGHVIEEVVRLDATRTGDYAVQAKIEKEFDDYEDFAELFAKYINKDSWISYKQIEAMEFIINFYNDKVFTKEAIAWVAQPRWKRELDFLIESHGKSLNYCESQDGAFNKCKKTCEAVVDRLSELAGVSIVRCEGYNGSLKEAHPKWNKVDSDAIVHYVLEVDGMVIDLTAKQFDEKESFPKIVSKDDFTQNWREMLLHKGCDLSRVKCCNLKTYSF